MAAIVRDLEPITLVGAGPVLAADFVRCLKIAPRLVAVDGGTDHALHHGIVPDLVIGDLDSLHAESIAKVPAERIQHITEQESTDFEKALRSVASPLLLGVGFTGARLDHQLACFNALVSQPQQRCILISDTDIAFLAPPKLELPLVAGTRVSLFPMGPVEGVSEGLSWPIDGLKFTPDGRIGTSNQAEGKVTLQFSSAKMLAILPKNWLEIVVKELAEQPATWPALGKQHITLRPQ